MAEQPTTAAGGGDVGRRRPGSGRRPVGGLRVRPAAVPSQRNWPGYLRLTS